MCASGRATELTYDLRDDLQTIWGFGSACDGVAHILLEPLSNPSWLREADAIRHARAGGAVVTIISDASCGGTIAMFAGAECRATRPVAASPSLIPEMRTLAIAAERTGRPVLESIRVNETLVPCFIEPLIPPVALHLVGAGRGAEAFARIATTIGWDVTIIDHREALLHALALPTQVRTMHARADVGATSLSADSRTAIALLTHMFETDLEWLTALASLPFGYLGVLGSRQRATRLLDTLRERGVFIPDVEQRLFAPIGLDLGGETPESIALAAIAEIEAVMHARPGGALRDRDTPIHTRTETPR